MHNRPNTLLAYLLIGGLLLALFRGVMLNMSHWTHLRTYGLTVIIMLVLCPTLGTAHVHAYDRKDARITALMGIPIAFLGCLLWNQAHNLLQFAWQYSAKH